MYLATIDNMRTVATSMILTNGKNVFKSILSHTLWRIVMVLILQHLNPDTVYVNSLYGVYRFVILTFIEVF